MKLTLVKLAATLAITLSVGQFEAQAASKRYLTQMQKKSLYASTSEDLEDLSDEIQPQRKAKRKFNKHTYVRIQQLPFLGMAAVSDNGVLDLEVMRAVNEYFHIGPTSVFHYGTQDDTKMKSLNLGVRADFILPNFGEIDEVYISSAFMLGQYSSSTKIVQEEGTVDMDGNIVISEKVSCDYRREGYHRVGAMAVGKIWRLSDSLHLTTGLGAVRTKTFGGTTKSSGFCSDKRITESDGTSLPWLDFGVGFKI